MPRPFADSLCHRCAVPPRYVKTATSTFVLCPAVPEKYPRQPVRACPAFRPAVVATERLVLRALAAGDAPFDASGAWLAVERASATPIGQIGLVTRTVDGADEPTLACYVHPPFRRRGYAVEGAAAVRDLALARFDHLLALVPPDDAAASALLRRLGFVPGRTVDDDGQPRVAWRADRPPA